LQMNTTPLVLIVLAGVAGVWQKSHPQRAAELLGLAMNHPAHDGDVDKIAKSTLVALRTVLATADLEAALSRGKNWPLKDAAAQVLAEADQLR